MGLHREIERMLARPNDTVLLREIISFLAANRCGGFTLAEISSKLHRPTAHIEILLAQLVALEVLTRAEEASGVTYTYKLRGMEAFEVEQFARSKGFHEQKLVQSTDRFRSLYQRRAHG